MARLKDLSNEDLEQLISKVVGIDFAISLVYGPRLASVTVRSMLEDYLEARKEIEKLKKYLSALGLYGDEAPPPQNQGKRAINLEK